MIFYNNCQNSRALIGSYVPIFSIRVQTIKMTSDVTRAFTQRKTKPIPLVRFPYYGEKQIDVISLLSILVCTIK